MTRIILATTSPFRIPAFRRLGIPFETEDSEIDERAADRPIKAEALVAYLARKKAESVASRYQEGIVLGFDSVGELDGEIFEKPSSANEAYLRLRAMSGRQHSFFTGVSGINVGTGRSITEVASTDIWMREIEDWEIDKYLSESQDYAKHALGYAAFYDRSSSFVRRVEGSPGNLATGLPLDRIPEILRQLGYREQ